MVLPDEDKYSTTRNEMLDQLAYMLGGRVAEEIVFHDPTTGAGNDIEKATRGPRDGHRVRHDRARRRDQARPGHRRGRSSAATWATSATTPRTSRRSSTRRSARSSTNAHDEAFEILVENRDVLDALVARAAREGDARQGARSPRSSSRSPSARRVRRGPARPDAPSLATVPPVVTPASWPRSNGSRQRLRRSRAADASLQASAASATARRHRPRRHPVDDGLDVPDDRSAVTRAAGVPRPYRPGRAPRRRSASC